MKRLRDRVHLLPCKLGLCLSFAFVGNCFAFDGDVVRPLSECEAGAATDVRQLDSGMVIERELEGGQSHLYKISVYEKQFLNVVVDQRGIDVALTICAPD